jgi:kumamolisin
VAGSERAPVPHAAPLGPADPDESVAVTVVVRRRPDAASVDTAELGARALAAREYVSREEFAATRGAAPEDIAAVEAFARAHGLRVLGASPERRSVFLVGRAAELARAFGADLMRYRVFEREVRGRVGPLSVPVDLGGIVVGVFGLDDRPQAQPHVRFGGDAASVPGSFSPTQVASLYRFPTGLTGAGQCIGLIELGGGFDQPDLGSYFGGLGLTPPVVVVVPVDGGANSPTGDPSGPDGEVLLDIEIAASVAPAAKVVTYFAPNTDRGFLDAVSTAIHDRDNAPSVISISWGSAESRWTAQAQRALDDALVDAATLGVTVCAAAGDNGSADGVGDGLAHVDFPASSPHVLACGGTRLSGGSAIVSEVVWNGGDGGATGGGISQTFDLPSWQQRADVPASINPDGRIGRGVPDVAGDADPQTGYQVEVDRENVVLGGTSAVAPLWAGLIALFNEHLGKPVGYLNPLLYARSSAFHDITSGNNAVDDTPGYRAAPGWDACTGLGTPDGTGLLASLTEPPPPASRDPA